MENNHTNYLLKSSLNGAFHQNNYVWGGAMNLCWNTLASNIIYQPIKLQTKDNLAQHMVNNFNYSKFSKNDLQQNSYYTKAGFGQDTLTQINKECKEKFPNKSFKDIQLVLRPDDIISYAYFVKEVQYLTPFQPEENFCFEGKYVRGFKAKSKDHYDNLRVCAYLNPGQFILKLLLKQNGQELFILKGYTDALPEEITEIVGKHSQVEEAVKNKERFEMPMIEMDVKRDYTQLIGSSLKNQKFSQYFIGAMFEGIKFRMDEVGAKVENQAVIKLTRSRPVEPDRSFIVNSSFWVVMRQKERHPYFVAQFNNTEFMIPSKK